MGGQSSISFGKQLRIFRRNGRDPQVGGALSQVRLADLLSEACGIIYSRAAISDWERSKGQIHKDARAVLVGLVQVLVATGGLQSLAEANGWLAAGNYRRLDSAETEQAGFDEVEAPATSSLRFMVPTLPAHPILGRGDLLTQLKRQLFTGHNVALSAINGMPGVGKTTMATLLAHDTTIQTHFPDGVLWVGLGRDPDIYHLLGQWGQAVGISEADLAQMGAIKLRANAIHEQIKAKQMLLILDDVWQREALEPFKLGGSNCTHIMTTRQPPLAVAFAGSNALKVSELTEKYAIELLHSLAPQVFIQNATAARDIVVKTGGLPLALVLIGNYLRIQAASGNSRRIKAALERVISAEARFQIQKPQSILDKDTHPSLPSTAPISLSTIIGASYEVLSDEARRTLRTLALFPPKPNSFSEEAALDVADTTTDALDELVDQGLIEYREQGRYSLHQSIHEYAHSTKSINGTIRFVTYFETFLTINQKSFKNINAELENIFTALTYTFEGNHTQQLLNMTIAFFPFLEQRGMYELARKYSGQCFQLGQEREHTKALATLNYYIGRIEVMQDRYPQAEKRWLKGLELAYLAGAENLLIDMVTNLANLLSEDGRIEEADKLLEKGLSLARKTTQKEKTIRLFGTIGRIAYVAENYKKARIYLSHALEIAQESNLQDLECGVFNLLGAVAYKLCENSVAKQHYQSGLEIARSNRNRERISVLLTNLGQLLYEDGEYLIARQYADEALQIAEQSGNQLRISHLKKDIGLILWRSGNIDSARIHLKNAIHLAKQYNSPIRLYDTWLAWGQIALENGFSDEAEKCFKNCLAMNCKKGVKASALFGLAKILNSQKQEKKAYDHIRKSLEYLHEINQLPSETMKAFIKKLNLQTHE